jgi:hypothetical protein
MVIVASRKKATAPQGGRPSGYSPALAEEICMRLMAPLSLNKLCQMDDMPSRDTVCRWLIQYPEFRAQYQTATEVRLDLLVDETVDIADAIALDAVDVSSAKLRIDTRWRMAERMAPRKYGVKQQLDLNTNVMSHEQALELLK